MGLAFGKGEDGCAGRVGNIAHLGVDLLHRGLGACGFHGQSQRDHHVIRHGGVDVGGSRLARGLGVRGVKVGVRSALFVRHRIDGDDAFAHLGAQGLHQIGVGRPAGDDPLGIRTRLEPLAQDDGGVGQVRAHHDHIGLGGQNLLQLAAVARAVGFVGDVRRDLAAALFPGAGKAFHIAQARCVVERHGGRALETALGANLGKGRAKAVVGGLKAPHQVLGVQRRDGGRARHVHLDDARRIGQRHHRQRHARCPGAQHRLHLVHLNQLLGGQHGGVGLGLVVFGEEFKLAATRTACGVDFVHRQANGLLHAGAVRAACARDGRERADAEHIALLAETDGGKALQCGGHAAELDEISTLHGVLR